jgi:hypothetical protein
VFDRYPNINDKLYPLTVNGCTECSALLLVMNLLSSLDLLFIQN